MILQIEPHTLDKPPEGDRAALAEALPASEIKAVAEDEPFLHIEAHPVRENDLGLGRGIASRNAIDHPAVFKTGFPMPPGTDGDEIRRGVIDPVPGDIDLDEIVPRQGDLLDFVPDEPSEPFGPLTVRCPLFGGRGGIEVKEDLSRDRIDGVQTDALAVDVPADPYPVLKCAVRPVKTVHGVAAQEAVPVRVLGKNGNIRVDQVLRR